MPPFILNSEETVILPFDINNKKPKIYYIVEADSPVKVYLMDENGVKNLKNNTIDPYIESSLKKYHEEKAKLPFGGRWYIVISNLSKKNIAVNYEVYE